MQLPLVPGFRFAGVHAGIKKDGAPDLALAVADELVPAAAIFTTNVVRAAPVEIAEERVRTGKVRAILVNSGNANACTGRAGRLAALASTAAVARALGVEPEQVVPASTGVIGQQLPAGVIEAAAPTLVDALDEGGAPDFARAIMTTDKSEKVAHRTMRAPGGKITVLGLCKGAGMIHPDMATTLGFVFTDAKVAPTTLARVLRRSADATFNRISVDGDTSTNDTLAILASGRAGASLKAGSPGLARFERAVTQVLEELALQIVSDGEGAEHAVRVEIKGARSTADAKKAARTIATSPLVKTALHGCDPNWGRIVAAAGRSGARFELDRVDVRIGDVVVFKAGKPVMDGPTESRASEVMRQERYSITVKLGAGKAADHYITSDLGHEYVRINADYRS